MATHGRDEIRKDFPLLAEDFQITSPATINYNCVAWALGESDRWWGPAPGYYWPHTAPEEWSLSAIVHVLRALGYQDCPDDTLEPNVEKVAIYCDAKGEPTHVARQLESGRWTSKLGDWEDIEHALVGLAGADPAYGKVTVCMQRTSPGRRNV